MGLFSNNWDPKGKHCYVTGGSSGLGLTVALLLTKQGANVSIVARTETTLKKAHSLLEEQRVSPSQQLAWYSYPLNTHEGSAAALEAACAPYDGQVPDAAFLCAGAATPKFFVEMTEQDLKKGMEDGYWVQAFSALEIAKRTAKQRFKGGKLLFVGTTVSYMSFVGWASYAPPKHALRGLADTLRHELMLYHTDVHFFAAPTMKTPGYEHEMQTKPKLTHQIEGEDNHSLDDIAKCLVRGVATGQAHTAFDFNANIFRVSGKAATPLHTNLLMEIFFLLVAWIGVPIWRMGIDKDVRQHREEHEAYLVERGVIPPK
ncbi:3-dehydrosphinganine reductase [Tulasnella sp. 403]|nr:3-dehydrosphinganine reductase [Tulasnella sp. 403]